jgi:trans-aconitate 2-methyltransferase
VTAALLERLPAGHVIAVDASPRMVEHARTTLGLSSPGRVAGPHAAAPSSTAGRPARFPGSRADVRHAELPALPDVTVDAVFSNAVFHWVRDHDALFASLARVLRPGGRLSVQCGGRGNIAGFLVHVDAVAAEPPYAEHLAGWPGPWRFAGPEETEERLRAAGFAEARCWLEDRPVDPPDPRHYVATVVLPVHLERLPEPLRVPFVDAVLARSGPAPTLDYIRLNAVAVR